MPRRALNESLERLRNELADADSLPESERRRLEKLLGDVIRAAEGEAEDEEEVSLADRLQEATERFEESHPNVTMAIGAVAEALSRMGI